jgi:hypothetical protein
MPRLDIKHENTLIYKIVCNDLNIKDLYVGSTTDFIKRKWKHKSDCNNQNSKSHYFKIYQMIRANGGWENWTMIEIEKYPCNDSNEKRARERYWYENLDASLNSNKPMTTSFEIKEAKDAFYCKNKDLILLRKKQFRDDNKDKIAEIKRLDYTKKREDILTQKKIYASLKNAIKFECECGSTINPTEKRKHCKTLKHTDYLKSLNINI